MGPGPSRTKPTFPSRPGSALRHREVADCSEVADFVDARTCPQKPADVHDVHYSPDEVCCSVLQCVAVCCSVLQCVAMYTTPLMNPTTDLGLSRYAKARALRST